MKTISVVIPTYNRASYLELSIKSVLEQKLPKGYQLEIIIADDGSSDNTEQVLKPIKDQIVYLKLPHSGKPAVPRNAALKAAKGELVAFQDSDDLWASNKLISQLPVFDDPKVMLSFGQAEIIQENGVLTGDKVVDSKVLKDATSYEVLLQQNAISTLTVLARKDAVLSVGAFNESDHLKAIEDYDLWLRIAAKFPDSLRPLSQTLAYYRRHDQNISKGDTLKGIEDALKIYNQSWNDPFITAKQRMFLEKHIFDMNQNWSNHISELSPSKQPRTSVIMSVYNGSRFLKPAIDSILAQTSKDFEFIIIDDGSTDDSAKIIDSYEDTRIRLIRQTNHGLVYSLNKAIHLSRGEFIARMDADDISLPKRLQLELEWLKQSSANGLVSTYFEQIEFLNSKSNGVTVALPPNHLDLRRSLYFVNPFAHGATIFRKQAAIEAGLYRKTYGPTEDYDLWRRILRNWKGHLIPEVLFQYRVNNSLSISQLNNEEQSRFVSMIHDELWAEKFVRKNPIFIAYSYYLMRRFVPSKHLASVKNEYVNQQFTLAKFSLLRGYLLISIENCLGLLLIKPSYVPRLFNYIPRGIRTSIKRVK